MGIISKAYRLVSVEALVAATNDDCVIRVKLIARLSEWESEKSKQLSYLFACYLCQTSGIYNVFNKVKERTRY